MSIPQTNNEERSFDTEWFDLDEACELKGVNSKTARNQRWLQPRGGKHDAIIGRRRKWHRSTVLEWVKQTDEQLRRMAEEVE